MTISGLGFLQIYIFEGNYPVLFAMCVTFLMMDWIASRISQANSKTRVIEVQSMITKCRTISVLLIHDEATGTVGSVA